MDEKVTIAKVLVGTGAGTIDADPAVAAAAALADRQDAELVVVGPGGTFDQSHPHADHDILRHLTRRFPDLNTRSRQASGNSLVDVVEVAQQEMPDVLIVCNPFGADGGGPAESPPVDLGVLTTATPDTRSPGFVPSMRAFYSRRISWVALLVTSLLLTFGGGAVMFTLHARYRGEKGPAINDWYHWFLDSTIGFVTLTPVLFLILPGVLWALGDPGQPAAGTRRTRVRVWCYAGLVGLIFALVTGTGHMVHNVIAGEGTPLADFVTDLLGRDPAVAARNVHAPASSPLTESLLQLGAGMPVYVGLTWLSIHFIRATSRRRTPESSSPTDLETKGEAF